MLFWIFGDSEKPSNAPIMFSGYLHKWFLGATVNHKCLLIYDPAYKFGISLKAIWDNLEVGAGRLVSSPKRCHSTLTRKILAEGPTKQLLMSFASQAFSSETLVRGLDLLEEGSSKALTDMTDPDPAAMLEELARLEAPRPNQPIVCGWC